MSFLKFPVSVDGGDTMQFLLIVVIVERLGVVDWLVVAGGPD